MTTPFASAYENLTALGFHCLPVIAPDAPHGGKGKAPGDWRGGRWQGLSNWQRYRDQTLDGFALKLAMAGPGANIGLVCGSAPRSGLHVVAIDIDATDPDVLDTLLRSAPASPMVKRGAKGETRFYLAEKTIKTRSYDGPDGRLVDLLTGFDTRQTIVPPSVHPDTRQPYVWTAGPVRAADLPILTAEDVEALEEVLEQCGWERGGRGPAQREARPAPVDIDPDDLWEQTKAAAIGNLSAWVPALNLYGCRPARGGYEAVAHWRASSTGQPMEKRKRNLSINPRGIRDMGTGDTYSSIDLVMAARDCDRGAAVEWLRERLGLDDDGGDVVIALGQGSVEIPMDPTPPWQRLGGDLDATERGNAMMRELYAKLKTITIAETPETRAFEPEAGIPVSAESPVSSEFSDELPTHLLRCPGLVGEITDWICDTALQPQRMAALLAALQVVGTAAGRTFGGPTKTGTHLYGLFLAPSGASKDHPLKCIDRLLRASTMGAHVGPGEYMSMSALVSRLNRQPLTITAIDEFGDYLARINGRKSSPHEKAITRTLRTAWGSSFDTMATPEWAGRVGEPIFSPALSIFGVSTHEAFFKGLDGDDVFNGFLNRFIIFSTQQRVEEVEPALDKSIVPESISDQLVRIYTASPPMTRVTSHNQQSDGPLILVPWDCNMAQRAYLAYRQTCLRRETDAVFYTRSAEIAQRLATIRAIGIDPSRPRITLDDIDWGIALADHSARHTLAMARDYMSETQHQAETQLVLRTVRQGGGWKPYRDIARALNNRMRARDLRDILDGLVDSGHVDRREEQPPAGGHKIKLYRLAAA